MGLNALAAMTLVLTPFGPVVGHLQTPSVWHAFEANGPVLVTVRGQVVDTGDCDGWVTALKNLPAGVALGSSLPVSPDQGNWPLAWKRWEPWNEDDLSAIGDCDDLPCKVKLNGAEAAQMKAVSKDQRLKRYLSLVAERLARYQRTQERSPYEFPDGIVDPWTEFEKRGFKTALKRPPEPAFWARKLNLAPGKARNVRQILDRRFAVSGNGRSGGPVDAVLWTRDVYTAHYFDSWGEWVMLSCDPASKKLAIVQALLLEFDLLKETDLFSRMGRGKMRTTVENQGAIYLDDVFAYLRRTSGKTVGHAE